MSRSNSKQSADIKNPAKVWYEWSGSKGSLSFYDKEQKTNVQVAEGFTFIVLDELSVIKGWHEASGSGITSNEVRSTQVEPMVVRSFKGGELARGLYKEIRDKVASIGGHYTASIYIAYYDQDKALQIGNLQLKGAGLKAWLEFRGNNKREVYSKAVQVAGAIEGKKGAVRFKMPDFKIRDITPETNELAKKLDLELQEYLNAYFAGNQQAQKPTQDVLDIDSDEDIDF